jgi:ABC-type transporter Mla maintaining outer membrane lipid asymmetry ATPase subunit MlaF
MCGVQVAALSDSSLVVLRDVNWSVQPGEFWVVAGSPHAGKSDLLLHAAGLMIPVAGQCRLFGCETASLGEARLAERRRVGFVFADGKLFNQLTLAENIALPLRYHEQLKPEQLAATVDTLLDMMELKALAGLRPDSVAMVWRRRAALARALALKPDLLLLDNPNSGLTERHRRWLVDFLDQLWRGHDFLGGRPMTLVATTEDLRPWQHPQRHFAAVQAGAFAVLGGWGTEAFARHQTVKELLAAPVEAAKP